MPPQRRRRSETAQEIIEEQDIEQEENPRDIQAHTADEAQINQVIELAKRTIDERLRPAINMCTRIKEALAGGIDTIPIHLIQEWSVVIPLMCQDLIMMQAAYNLSKNLWDIETTKAAATNLLELRAKKTTIDQINKIAGTKGATEKAVKEYLRATTEGTKEALYQLSNSLRKTADFRIMSRDFERRGGAPNGAN